jgi:hypothetical protein
MGEHDNYKAEGYVGSTADGDAVYVKMEVTTGAKQVQTVDHGGADEVTRISIIGHYFQKGSRRKDYSGVGQFSDMVAAIVQPAPGLTGENLARLAEIWRYWHLNDMRAGCVHVPDAVYRQGNYGSELDLDNTPRCPETGYRWGSAWLYEEPPAEVISDLTDIGDKLDGTDGLRQ